MTAADLEYIMITMTCEKYRLAFTRNNGKSHIEALPDGNNWWGYYQNGSILKKCHCLEMLVGWAEAYEEVQSKND